MKYLVDMIIRGFQYIAPDDILSKRITYKNINIKVMKKIYFSMDFGLSEPSIEKKLEYLRDRLNFELHEEGKKKSDEEQQNIGIFDLVNSFVKEVLVVENDEILCHYKYLKEWHRLRQTIGEDLMTAAACAYYDYKNSIDRKLFLWKRTIEHTNIHINRILQRGLSENHYHLRGSTPYFDLSWLSLMNSVTKKAYIDKLDEDRRNPRVRYRYSFKEKKYFIMHIQAALIRVYLYSYLRGVRIELKEYTVRPEWILEFILSVEKIGSFFRKRNLSRLEVNEQLLRDGCICDLLDEVFLNEAKKEVSQNVDMVNWSYERNPVKENFIQRYPKFYWFFWMKFPGIRLSRLSNPQIPWSAENMDDWIDEIRRMRVPLKLKECEHIFEGKNREIFLKKWDFLTRKEVIRLLSDEQELDSTRKTLQNVIYSLIDFSDKNRRDYAITRENLIHTEKWEKVVLTGERWLLYSMMKRYVQSNGNETVWNLLYIYLIIKESFRVELLQNNDKIGFENFQAFQKRKNWFTTQYSEGELARMAVREAFNEQKLQSLEVRIMARNSAKENIKMIQAYDREITKNLEEDWTSSYYYVFHFGKQRDNEIKESHIMCRHQKFREKIQKQADAILKMRKYNPEIAKRLRGIDACSSEDGCRPEIFAVVYRVLKSHIEQGREDIISIPQLRATYHVGEDNQDVLDGMRAIDEAIYFLNLDYGDRLGHAMALGIDVEEWYRQANYEISIRQQDYLDNIVWLYHKILYYKIPDEENVLKYLEKEFYTYFEIIYARALSMNENEKIFYEATKFDKEFGNRHEGSRHFDFNMYSYYNAWRLRGDNPELYREGYYKRVKKTVSIWDDYGFNKYVKGKKVRYSLEANILYYMYHYNNEVKIEGARSIIVKITPQMTKMIFFVQKELQKEIAQKGLAIETNPTSNVKISMLSSYGKHPIVRFYNKGLVCNEDELKQCAQINVSINTDDLGVFSTCLRNEYTLMAHALESLRDSDGNPVYKKDMVYDWLDNVRQMGNEQSFLLKKNVK